MSTKKTQHPLLALSVRPAYLGVSGRETPDIGIERQKPHKAQSQPVPGKKQDFDKKGVSEAAQDMQTGSESVEQENVATTPAATRENPNPTRLSATAPGQLRVIKRNGTVVPFEDSKITVAITKAFLAVEGGTAAASSRDP